MYALVIDPEEVAISTPAVGQQLMHAWQLSDQSSAAALKSKCQPVLDKRPDIPGLYSDGWQARYDKLYQG